MKSNTSDPEKLNQGTSTPLPCNDDSKTHIMRRQNSGYEQQHIRNYGNYLPEYGVSHTIEEAHVQTVSSRQINHPFTPSNSTSRRLVCPSPLRRSVSRDSSSRSGRSSSAEESGGNFSSSGIGLSESGSNSSRCGSSCCNNIDIDITNLTLHTSQMSNSEDFSCDGSMLSHTNTDTDISMLTLREVSTLSSTEVVGNGQPWAVELQRKELKEFHCPLCHNLYTDPLTLPCAHNFCSECIANYLAKKRKIPSHSCPVCREPINLQGDDITINQFQKNSTLRKICEGYRSRKTKSASFENLLSPQ